MLKKEKEQTIIKIERDMIGERVLSARARIFVFYKPSSIRFDDLYSPVCGAGSLEVNLSALKC